MYFSQFCIYHLLKKGVAVLLNKLECPTPKDTLLQVWLKLDKWFWRRRFYDFVNVFSLFRNYLSLDKGVALDLNKFESPLPKNVLCQVWLKLAQWFCRRRFLNTSMYVLYFEIISPSNRTGPIILTKWNPLYPRMIYAKFGWNLRSGSGKEDFLNTSIYFRYFVINSPWNRAEPIWTNLNPLYPRMFCAKFGWDWPSGSWEEVFKKLSM